MTLKKWSLLLLLPVFLFGCGNEPAMETITDAYTPVTAAPIQEMALDLPDGAAVAVMESKNGKTLYFCDEYTICLEALPAGDVQQTLLSVTGQDQERLRPIQTKSGETVRYDCVWTCAGETEEQVCRAAILDDGNYHYVLTCMTDQTNAFSLQETWNRLFSSFCLTAPGEDPYTGS